MPGHPGPLGYVVTLSLTLALTIATRNTHVTHTRSSRASWMCRLKSSRAATCSTATSSPVRRRTSSRLIWARGACSELRCTHESSVSAQCRCVLIAHCFIAHGSWLILLIAHCSLLMAHCSLLIAHCPLLVPSYPPAPHSPSSDLLRPARPPLRHYADLKPKTCLLIHTSSHKTPQ